MKAIPTWIGSIAQPLMWLMGTIFSLEGRKFRLSGVHFDLVDRGHGVFWPRTRNISKDGETIMALLDYLSAENGAQGADAIWIRALAVLTDRRHQGCRREDGFHHLCGWHGK